MTNILEEAGHADGVDFISIDVQGAERVYGLLLAWVYTYTTRVASCANSDTQSPITDGLTA